MTLSLLGVEEDRVGSLVRGAVSMDEGGDHKLAPCAANAQAHAADFPFDSLSYCPRASTSQVVEQERYGP